MSINVALLAVILMTAASAVVAIKAKNVVASKIQWALTGYGIGFLINLALAGARLELFK